MHITYGGIDYIHSIFEYFDMKCFAAVYDNIMYKTSNTSIFY